MEILKQFLLVCAVWCFLDQVHSVSSHIISGSSPSRPSIATPPLRKRFSECGKSKKTEVDMLSIVNDEDVVADKLSIVNDEDVVADKLSIINGKDALLGDWPWMVGIMNGSPKQPSSHSFCGGSLISRQWVITAAHCVLDPYTMELKNANTIFVRLGELDFDDRIKDGAVPIDAAVDKLVPHAEFASHPLGIFDIALIRMKDPIHFTENIHPICLFNGEEYRTNEYYYDKNASAIGWGALKYYGESPTRLQEVSLEVVTQEKCKENAELAEGYSIDEKVICVGGSGRSACNGDSGGPLMFLNDTEARFYLGGIASYVIECTKSPVIYTKVAYFISWINKVTGEDF